MKKVVFMLLAAMMLAACDPKSATPATEPAAASRDRAAAEPAPAPRVAQGSPIPQPLAEGVRFSFPHHFRSQTVDSSIPGRTKLRITVEFLGDDVATVADTLIKDMKAAGFRVAKDETTPDARRMLLFRKDGFGPVQVQVAPKAGRPLKHRAASGTVYSVWPHAGQG